MTWNEYLVQAERILGDAGVEEARANVEYLAAHVLRLKNRGALREKKNSEVSEVERKTIDKYVDRRTRREPLQYILGEWEFYGIPIDVNSSVLIPRPETELLVEETLREAEKKSGSISVLDIGTGSGCIAIALAKHLPHADVVGIDVNGWAVNLARKNAKKLNLHNVHFRRGDIFSKRWSAPTQEHFDFVVSNPPYISRNDFEQLEPELRLYEPRNALTDDDDGFRFYWHLAKTAPLFLRKDGYLLLELGYGMDEGVKKILLVAGMTVTRIENDLTGIPRVLIAKLSNK